MLSVANLKKKLNEARSCEREAKNLQEDLQKLDWAFANRPPSSYSMLEQREASTSESVAYKHKHVVGQDQSRIDEILATNRRVADPFMLNKCEKEAARNWNLFYKHHEGT